MWWLLEPTAYCPCCCLTVKRHHLIPGILKTIFNCSISLHDIHQLKHILIQSMIVREKQKWKSSTPPIASLNLNESQIIISTFCCVIWCDVDKMYLSQHHVFSFARSVAQIQSPRSAETTPNHSWMPPVRAASAWERYTTLPSRGCVGLKMSIMGCPVQNRHCWTIASSWGNKRMNARGSLATIKGNRVSADETVLYIWMQEKTQ